jgi:hypothetical protein
MIDPERLANASSAFSSACCQANTEINRIEAAVPIHQSHLREVAARYQKAAHLPWSILWCLVSQNLIVGMPAEPVVNSAVTALNSVNQVRAWFEEFLDFLASRERPADKQDYKFVVSAKALESLVGDKGVEILRVAQSDLALGRKMRDICRIDNRYLGCKPPEWAGLLGVSSAAIQQTEFWKNLRQSAE